MEVSFTIYGRPIAKGRPRFTKSGYAYTPQATVNYENLVKMSYTEQTKGAWFEDSAIVATLVVHCPIPKSTPKKNIPAMISGETRPTSRPDLDNIAKAILDALNGVAYTDDSNVIELSIQRRYTDLEPRVAVTLAKYVHDDTEVLQHLKLPHD